MNSNIQNHINHLKTKGLANIIFIYNEDKPEIVFDYCKAVSKAVKVLNGIENGELNDYNIKDVEKVSKAWERIIPVRKQIKDFVFANRGLFESKSLYETFTSLEYALFQFHCFINDEGNGYSSFEEWMILAGFQSKIG